jgi:hypothetical protein
MKNLLIILLIIALTQSNLNAQTEIDTTNIELGLIKNASDIDEMIEIKKDDPQQVLFLKAFQENYHKVTQFSVTEFPGHYEILVSRPGEEGYTGGAECYEMDKKTGKTRMIWHEHPMKIPEIEFEYE